LLFVDNGGITDARINLALEEHVLRNKVTDEDVLFLYVNAPAIIIGRNQNTIEELDSDVVAARGIRVVRRISGGGAVYHDLGNLNFSFMTREVHARFNRYDLFNEPVIEVLRELGVSAEIGARGSMFADGRKISGNAQFATSGRMLSHGTLLVDSKLDDVNAALRPKPGTVESKGVKSIRSRVANISELLREPITVDELRGRILERIFGTRDRARIPMLELDDADWRAAQALLERRYDSWAWNYGENPPSSVRRSRRFPAGELELGLDIHGGCMAAVRISGDLAMRAEVHELESRLRGLIYDRDTIADALSQIDVSRCFGDVSRQEVLAFLSP
jgi:lipoate-protein ligase A